MYTPRTVYVTYVAAPPEKVWAALTGADFTRQYFFGRLVESDWRVGSTVCYRMADGTLDVQGKVLECDPPRLLSFTWHVESNEEVRKLPDNLVTFRLDALGDVRTAAARLTVHPNTLRYRLRRASEVAGIDLDDPSARIVHHLHLLRASR